MLLLLSYEYNIWNRKCPALKQRLMLGIVFLNIVFFSIFSCGRPFYPWDNKQATALLYEQGGLNHEMSFFLTAVAFYSMERPDVKVIRA